MSVVLYLYVCPFVSKRDKRKCDLCETPTSGVSIRLQHIIIHTGIMCCKNLCHSKVVWKYYSGLGLIVGFWHFVGWCPHAQSGATVKIF